MRHRITLLAGVVYLAACAGPAATDTAADLQARALSSQSLGSSVNRDLATLRRVTASFHNFATASGAGWSAQITPCMTDPGGAGGMGFHYGKVSLIDGSVSVDEPELLLYEPENNGRLRLVAVEYIIPYTFRARSATPPVLFGEQFVRNDVFQLWALHAWVWKENPSGIFASWNPRVNCDNSVAVMSMSH
jgi:hypothetical protein